MPGSSQLRVIRVSWWLPQLFFVHAHLFTAQVTVQLIHQSMYFEVCESCDQGFFESNSFIAGSCLPCSTCTAGQGIKAPCNSSHDTVCEPCTEGTYAAAGPECVPCTDCLSHGRQEDSPCSSTRDSVCGKCAKSYFLYIDSEGSKCLPCSPCPEDRVAVHWIECAQAGLNQDYQCAPGEVPSNNGTNQTEPVNGTATTEEPTTSNQTTAPEPVDVTIPTDRGGFVDQTESQPLTTEHPSDEIGIAITAASVVFTFTTLVVFSCAVGYVSWRFCRKHLSKCIRVAKSPKATSSPLLEEGEPSVDATPL